MDTAATQGANTMTIPRCSCGTELITKRSKCPYGCTDADEAYALQKYGLTLDEARRALEIREAKGAAAANEFIARRRRAKKEGEDN
jgi:hypothetical protein